MRQRKSRDQLGHDVGVSRQQIARYETGENIPNIVMAGKLAKALGCKASAFLDGDSSIASWIAVAAMLLGAMLCWHCLWGGEHDHGHHVAAPVEQGDV